MKRHYMFFKGRVALYAILKALGIQQGDEVIVPGFTCIVVPNAVKFAGGKPVYVDIDRRTFNIDPAKIEEKINQQTRVILVQHTFGIPAAMDRILEIAKKKDLYVIEDSCHTLGSRYIGKKVGTFGDAAFFSSQWSKTITTGLGGWAVINNSQLIERMDRVYELFPVPAQRESMILRLQYAAYQLLFFPSTFWFVQGLYRNLAKYGVAIGSCTEAELMSIMPPGYEKRMAAWQVRLLQEKMKVAPRIDEHRKKIAAIYEELLKEREIETVQLSRSYDTVFLRYPVLVENKKEILELAKRRRCELGDWFVSPLHPNLSGWDKVGYERGMCPVAEDVSDRIINLPTHERIKEKDAVGIIDFTCKVGRYSKAGLAIET